MTAAVKADLAKDVRPGPLTGIEVDITIGVVTPAGKVHRLRKSPAVSMGVVKVNDNLQVVPK